jgi:hypothetical protein
MFSVPFLGKSLQSKAERILAWQVKKRYLKTVAIIIAMDFHDLPPMKSGESEDCDYGH